MPWVRGSADKSYRGPITRAGSPRLRWIMLEAVITEPLPLLCVLLAVGAFGVGLTRGEVAKSDGPYSEHISIRNP